MSDGLRRLVIRTEKSIWSGNVQDKVVREIERLRELLDQADQENAGLESCIEDKDKRIKELKQECDEYLREIDYLASNEVVTTTEDIDRAWEEIQELKTQGVTGNTIALVLEEVLKKHFHIVACEECGGSGKDGYVAHDPHGVFEELGYDTGEGDCPACDGHRWKVVNDE